MATAWKEVVDYYAKQYTYDPEHKFTPAAQKLVEIQAKIDSHLRMASWLTSCSVVSRIADGRQDHQFFSEDSVIPGIGTFTITWTGEQHNAQPTEQPVPVKPETWRDRPSMLF